MENKKAAVKSASSKASAGSEAATKKAASKKPAEAAKASTKEAAAKKSAVKKPAHPKELDDLAPQEIHPELWELRLYVAGNTQKSITALRNLKAYCEEHLAGQYTIEVIDLLQHPQLAEGDQILAIPTVVKKVPEPIRKIIGDLSNKERVLIGLDIRPAA